jgi:hypothetical protein
MRRLLVAASFGFAASALGGCGPDVSEKPSPRPQGGSGGSGGSSAGTGGSLGTAGGGGSAAGGSGGTLADADAGMGDAAPAAGEFSYPAGCPVPNPVGITAQKFAIQSVNFDTSEVVLKNISTIPQVITGQRLGWQWCSFPSYWNIAPEGDVTVAPGKTYKFLLNFNTEGIWQLAPEGAELAIYVASGTFDEPDKLVSFVSWADGLPNTGREGVATLAGLWTLDSRIDISSAAKGFIATGTVKLGSGYQSVPARCLVAPPNE